MAGAACKIIINNGSQALAASLERVLIMVRGTLIKDSVANDLIQRMADIDIAAYHGGEVPEGGLLGVMKELRNLGVLSDDVWKIYANEE